MTKLCQNCSKQMTCKQFNQVENCNRFKSFLETKNYGEVKRIEKICTNDIKQRKQKIHIRKDVS